jgi:hypothetical protein
MEREECIESPIAPRSAWDPTYPTSVRVSSSTTMGNPLTFEASTYLSALLRESIEEDNGDPTHRHPLVSYLWPEGYRYPSA